MVSQLVLLPLQVRMWGPSVTAQWFVLIATANLMSVADLGLRNVGHDQLLSDVKRRNGAACSEFRQVWALTRALVLGFAAAFLTYQLLFSGKEPLLSTTVLVSVTMDTIVILRGIWLDTLGYFNRVEVAYLGMIASRVILSILALMFGGSPIMVAAIMLLTSAMGVVTQVWLVRVPALAFFTGGFRELNWRSLCVIRFVLSEPLVGCVRLHLPVIVLATLASPALITTFVAIRAVFGFPRQIVSQLTRYASVVYVQRFRSSREGAERVAIRAILGITAISVAASNALIADDGRLVRAWLGAKSTDSERLVVLALALATIPLSYQVAASILIRSGNVTGVAKRQYVYLFVSLTCAVAARLLTGSVHLYLASITLQELVIAGLFAATLGARVRRVVVAALFIGASSPGLMWGVVDADVGHVFTVVSWGGILATLVLAGSVTAVALFLLAAIDCAARGSGWVLVPAKAKSA